MDRKSLTMLDKSFRDELVSLFNRKSLERVHMRKASHATGLADLKEFSCSALKINKETHK